MASEPLFPPPPSLSPDTLGGNHLRLRPHLQCPLTLLENKRPLEFLTSNSGKRSPLNRTRNLLISLMTQRARILKQACDRRKCSIRPFPRPPYSQCRGSGEPQGLSPVLPRKQLREATVHTGTQSRPLMTLELDSWWPPRCPWLD